MKTVARMETEGQEQCCTKDRKDEGANWEGWAGAALAKLRQMERLGCQIPVKSGNIRARTNK
jgi:hypothetical protein